MSPGGWKTLCTEDRTFWCCTGRALEEFSKLNDTIYSRDNDGVYVNLFIPADLNWSEREIRLRQQTKFPDEPRTSIEVIQAPSSRWTLNLRIPGWTGSSASVKINGKPLDIIRTLVATFGSPVHGKKATALKWNCPCALP